MKKKKYAVKILPLSSNKTLYKHPWGACVNIFLCSLPDSLHLSVRNAQSLLGCIYKHQR